MCGLVASPILSTTNRIKEMSRLISSISWGRRQLSHRGQMVFVGPSKCPRAAVVKESTWRCERPRHPRSFLPNHDAPASPLLFQTVCGAHRMVPFACISLRAFRTRSLFSKDSGSRQRSFVPSVLELQCTRMAIATQHPEREAAEL